MKLFAFHVPKIIRYINDEDSFGKHPVVNGHYSPVWFQQGFTAHHVIQITVAVA